MNYLDQAETVREHRSTVTSGKTASVLSPGVFPHSVPFFHLQSHPGKKHISHHQGILGSFHNSEMCCDVGYTCFELEIGTPSHLL